MICDICEAAGDGVAMIMAMAITVAVEHVLDCSEKRYGGWIGGWVPVLIKKEKELKRKIYNLNIRLLRNVQDAGGSCFLLIKKHPDIINRYIRRGLFIFKQLLHLLYMLFHSPSQSRHFLCSAMQIASFPTSVDLGFVVCHLQCSVWAV